MALSGFRMESVREKYAELVGDERNPGESDGDFKNRIIGSLDLINQPKKVAINLDTLNYKCVGRDDSKVANFKAKGVEVESKLVPIGHVSTASEILIGKLSRENPPKFFICGYGNIWEMVEVGNVNA